MTPASLKIICDFHALYAGGLAQDLRNAGSKPEDAMPPWTETYWLGKQVVKCPMDLWTYQEIIWETKPDILIETGTSGSGSAFFFATLFDLIGNGRVLTVDKDAYPALQSSHPRITYFTGDSVDPETIAKIRAQVNGKVMVALDSLHTYEHVKAELEAYASLVTPACYLVVEDTGLGGLGGATADMEPCVWATKAVLEFIRDNPAFEVDLSREKHLLTSNHSGWIRRING